MTSLEPKAGTLCFSHAWSHVAPLVQNASGCYLAEPSALSSPSPSLTLALSPAASLSFLGNQQMQQAAWRSEMAQEQLHWPPPLRSESPQE